MQVAAWREMFVPTVLRSDVRLTKKGFMLILSKENDREEGVGSCIDGKKGVAWKDEDWCQGDAEILVHRNFIKEHILYDGILRCSPLPSSIPTLPPNANTVARRYILQRDTGVVNYGAAHVYIVPTALHGPTNTNTPKICVGTATGHVESSSATASLSILQLAEDFSNAGYIMPFFTKTLVGAGPIWNADCAVLFTKHNVTVFLREGKPILTGWI